MPSLKDQLTLHESLKLKPYTDTVGKLTIGVGRNLTDRGITTDESLYLLDNDIKRVTNEVKLALPWFDNLDPVRRKVVLDMAFNMGTGIVGISGLLAFTNTLRAMKEGRYKDAAAGMLASLWAQQTKTRATRLAKMMETGADYLS